jgi:hypothetical protein
MGKINEIYVSRKSVPTYCRPISIWACRALLGLGIVIATAIVIGIRDRQIIRRAEQTVVAAEARAAAAESKLKIMFTNGDYGILVANIGPDLAGYQLRLVPGRTNNRRMRP